MTKWLSQLYRIGLAYPRTVICMAVGVTLLSLLGVKRLVVVNDFASLLPQNVKSVQSLNEIKNRFGGTGFLVVTFESDNSEFCEQFADNYVSHLKNLPDILFVDYRRPIDFFTNRRWLYLDLEGLDTVSQRMKHAIELERQGVSSVFNDLLSFADEENKADLSFEDIFEKYKTQVGWDISEKMSSQGGHFLVVRIKPREGSQDLDANRRLLTNLQEIEHLVRNKLPQTSVTVGYTGNYIKSLEQASQTKKEMSQISILVFVLLFLILYFSFRNLGAAFLIGIPLAMSVVCTGGLTYLFLKHVNMITGFAGAILAGLGSDYGIYLLSRYDFERRAGHNFRMACQKTFIDTGRATFGSMLTTAGVFTALTFSEFRLFVEFGIVGLIGIVSTYFFMIIVLPALLSLSPSSKKIFGEPLRFPKHVPAFLKFFFSTRGAWIGMVLFVVISLLALSTIPSQSKITFDENLLENKNLPSYRLNDRVAKLFQTSLNPSLLMVDNASEEMRSVNSLQQWIDHHPTERMFQRVLGLTTFIPSEQDQKKAAISKLIEQAKHLKKTFQRDLLLSSLNTSLESLPVTSETLPEEIKRHFIFSQNSSYAIYLYPAFNRTDVPSMRRYHEGVENILRDLSIHSIVADNTFISDDTVRVVEKEAPRGMLWVIGFLTVVTLLTIRPFSRGIILLGHLLAGLVILSGTLFLLKIPLNVLNIAVVPIVLGTGIDCLIHFSHRYDEERNLHRTIKIQLPSIFISNLTSIVGFAGLLLTSSAGLRSTGWVATLGLGIMTMTCAFILPRALALIEKHRA